MAPLRKEPRFSLFTPIPHPAGLRRFPRGALAVAVATLACGERQAPEGAAQNTGAAPDTAAVQSPTVECPDAPSSSRAGDQPWTWMDAAPPELDSLASIPHIGIDAALPVPRDRIDQVIWDQENPAAVEVATLDGKIVWISVGAREDEAVSALADVSGPVTLRLDSKSLSSPAIRDAVKRVTDAHPVGIHVVAADDAALEQLTTFTRLRSLSLYKSRVTARGLASLRGMTELVRLDLSRSTVGDEELRELASFATIETLTLVQTHITDKGLADLGKMTSLRSLDLKANDAISDDGLANLSCLTELRELILPKITLAGLRHVGKHAKLERLEVSSLGFEKGGFAALAPLSGLSELSVTWWNSQAAPELTAADLDDLAKLPALRELELIGARLGGPGPYFKGFGSLQALNLRSATISEPEIMNPGELQALQTLSINADGIGDATLVRVGQLPALRELALPPAITDAGLAHLVGLTSLQVLDLTSTAITDAGLAHLVGLTSLQVLNLKNTAITDAGLQFLSGLSSLEKLNLQFAAVTDQGIALLSGLYNLKHLYLIGGQTTQAGRDELRLALPGCKVHY